MTALDERPAVAAPIAPGIYPDLPHATYLADPALSASGAKRLLSPGAPALFRHERDSGGRGNKRTFDVGTAAHKAVLGVGPDLTIVDAPDWRTKWAQAARDEAYAAGDVPILAAEKREVDAMAAALLLHPLAADLFAPGSGRPEVSVFWRDDARGIDRRARFDWLPVADHRGVLVMPDYKTAASAEPHAFSRSMFAYGYDVQAVYYADAVVAAGLATDVTVRFVAQEKTAPYLVTVHELDSLALALGRARVNEACEVFRRCTETGVWPGYSDDVELVGPPAWLAAQYGLDDMAV